MARDTLAGPLAQLGGGRYRIEGLLGSGAFGAVYRAFDAERGRPVALKLLRRTGPSAQYRFKREFRSLADVVHPNLITLYELSAEGEQLYFTMELIHGVDFLEWVRPREMEPQESFDSDSFDRAARARRATRLRDCLRQLAEGLEALHAAGHLHRDLKPANVLVTPEGRVVLLDFGLVTELLPAAQATSLEVVGSPGYMAPEQAAEAPAGAAADWYAVGVMLFEALTGELPFRGRPLHVMVQKQTADAPRLATLAADAPADLAELCDALLARDPARRPSGGEVLARIAADSGPSAGAPSSVVRAPSSPFVGRRAELRALGAALDESRRGVTSVVLLHGPSGMGKSALSRRFLHDAAGQGALVLRGRCYEQEAVAYKGLDSVVDDLSRVLRSMPEDEVQALLPADVASLVRLFPVLEQVGPLADIAHRSIVIPDPQQLRRLAFGAFRELQRRLAASRPLVMSIDDAQWGDADSARLLREMLRPPDPPPILLLIGYRTEETGPSPFLSTLLPLQAPIGTPLVVRELALAELPPEDATALARSLMHAPEEGRAEVIAREAKGRPLFIEELVRHEAEGGRDSSRPPSLGDALSARVERLSVDGRRLLEVLAVAGRPVDRAVSRIAAGIEGDEVRLVASMRAANLVRSRRATSGHASLETFHDRVRTVVLSDLPHAARRDIHRRIVVAHREVGGDDPEILAPHLEGAGESHEAALSYLRGAERAFGALAWDRAARLYRRAIDLDPALDPRGVLATRLGDALSNAGRGAEAARAYGEASERVSPEGALELRRRAAEQLLRSGHVDAGYRALDAVLREVGLRLRSLRATVLALGAKRARLRLRGLRFRERPEAQIAPEILRRIDVAWSAGMGLGMVDSIRGSDFLTRSLLDALAAGEPRRVARSLAYEAAFSSNAGGAAAIRAGDLVRRTEAMAEQLGDPHLSGLAAGAACVVSFHAGRFHDCVHHGERAARIFRDECTNTVKEIVSVQLFQMAALALTGRLAQLSDRVPRYLRAAEERGDYYASTNLRSGLPNTVWLAADDPAGARREAREAMEGWSRDRFLLQHFFDLWAQVQIDLYQGDPTQALARLTESERDLAGSLLLRLHGVRSLAWDARGRAALAAAALAEPPARALHLRAALRAAGALEKEAAGWTLPLAGLLRAGAARLEGDGREVDRWLARAAAGFEGADMAAHAAAARRARALRAGDSARVRQHEVTLAALGVRNPARYAALLAPGLG